MNTKKRVKKKQGGPRRRSSRKEDETSNSQISRELSPGDILSSSPSASAALVAVPEINFSSPAALIFGSKSLSVTKSSVGIRPTPDECRWATTELSKIHPEVVEKNDERRKTLLESCGMRDSLTDAIVSTMLTQNTTDANSKAAFYNLKKRFPSWDKVANLDCNDLLVLENAIRVAGLAKTRAERIHAFLRTIRDERGEISVEYLRNMSDEEVKKELSRFKGLGPKTISCVLLFGIGRSEFPVDTHVLRITKKMGWVSNSSTRESAYVELNAKIPSDVKLDLHCLLVAHGKHCHRCAANGRPQFAPTNGKKLPCPLFNERAPVNVLTPEQVKSSMTVPIFVKEEPHEQVAVNTAV